MAGPPDSLEAADTGPFFHNNSIETVEGAVAFYDTDAFNNSPAGLATGGIRLEATQVVTVAVFLRVVNALENIRASMELLRVSDRPHPVRDNERIRLAYAETEDAMDVLAGAGRHPQAVIYLRQALAYLGKGVDGGKRPGHLGDRGLPVQKVIRELERARAMIE